MPDRKIVRSSGLVLINPHQTILIEWSYRSSAFEATGTILPSSDKWKITGTTPIPPDTFMNAREHNNLIMLQLSLRETFRDARAAIIALEGIIQKTEKAFADHSSKAQKHQQEQQLHRTRHLSEIEGLFQSEGQEPQ